MPSTTARGAPYPASSDPDNVPSDMQALAGWVNDRPGVATLTSAQRAALTGGALWVGRLVYDTDRDQLWRYGATGWSPAVDALVFVYTTISTSAITANGTATYTVPLGAPFRSAHVMLGSSTNISPGALLEVTTTRNQTIGMGAYYVNTAPPSSQPVSAAIGNGLGTLRCYGSSSTENITDCYLSGNTLLIAVSQSYSSGYPIPAATVPVVVQGRI